MNTSAKAALATLVLIAAACGGDDDARSSETETRSTPTATATETQSPHPVATTAGSPTVTQRSLVTPPVTPDPVSVDEGAQHLPASAWSVADIDVTLPADWTVQYGHVFHKHADEPQEIGVYPVLVDSIYEDACAGDQGATTPAGATVDDLATALLDQPGAVVTRSTATELGGFPASRVDVTFPVGTDMSACSLGGDGLQIWYSEPADKHFVLAADGVARVYIVDIDGQRQVFVVQYRSGTPDSDIAELETILESIAITPTTGNS